MPLGCLGAGEVATRDRVGRQRAGALQSLHLVGQLQSNKARPALALFNIVESVDRPSLIEALEKEAARRGEPITVLLEVNVARELQKGGCQP